MQSSTVTTEDEGENSRLLGESNPGELAPSSSTAADDDEITSMLLRHEKRGERTNPLGPGQWALVAQKAPLAFLLALLVCYRCY